MAETTAAMDTDTRIEAFRQTVERLTLIPGQLQTLAITLARADELPVIMARCSCRLDAARLREEQAAIGHPLGLRIRLSQLESELRQGLFGVRDQLRAAIVAASEYVGIAAGGPDVVKTFPFARRVLAELERHRVMLPATESEKVRLAFLESAWQAIDAALASLCEIQNDFWERRYARPRV
jgi:hypothetical protein